MKKILTKTVLLFIFPIFALFIVSEYFLRSIPNDYKYKSNWLTKNCKTLKVLNLGSSHGYYGINPQYFNLNGFNAAHVSQSLKYDYFIFNKYISGMDSLKFLILPISYFSFGGELENGIEDWRVKMYSIYYGCNYNKCNLKYNYEMFDFNSKTWNRVVKSSLGIENHIVCNKFGAGILNKLVMRDINWKNNGKVSALRHQNRNVNSKIVSENIKYLKSIINKCRLRNIYVILLTTPTCKSYYMNLDNEQLNFMETTCRSVAQNKNVIYLNLLKDIRFKDKDFFDVDHLSEYGSKKLTLLLNDRINNISHSYLK